MFVDGSCLSSQRLSHFFFKQFGLFRHHFVGFFKTKPHRVVTTCPRVVQRSLIRAKININILFVESFPHIYNVTFVSNGYSFFSFFGLFHPDYEFIHAGDDFSHPSLFEPFAGSFRVYFGCHRNNT